MAPNWRTLLGAQSADELLLLAMERLQAAGSAITNLNVGGVFRTLLELASQGLADVHDLLVAVVQQGFAAYATGTWQDLKAADVGLTRHAATATEGLERFYRSGTSGNVVIPAGTIMRTQISSQGEALEYEVSAETVLPDGESEVYVPIVARDTGSRYNVAPGFITELVTHVAGIQGVDNGEDWITSEGADEETDSELGLRIGARWPALSRGATADALRSWAAEVSGVVDVDVDDEFPRGAGTVDVIIAGAAGAPSEELIAEVQTLLDERRDICADLVVRGPDEIETAIRVRVWLPVDSGDEDDTSDAVLALYNSLMATGDEAAAPRLRVGQNLTRARLQSLAMSVDHVWDADVELPAANVVAEAGELVVLDGDIEVIIERGEP